MRRQNKDFLMNKLYGPSGPIPIYKNVNNDPLIRNLVKTREHGKKQSLRTKIRTAKIRTGSRTFLWDEKHLPKEWVHASQRTKDLILTSNGYYYNTHNNAIHRMVFEFFYGKITRGWDIHHIDGNPKHNHPNNLIALPHFCHKELHVTMRKEKYYFDRMRTTKFLKEWLFQYSKDTDLRKEHLLSLDYYLNNLEQLFPGIEAKYPGIKDFILDKTKKLARIEKLRKAVVATTLKPKEKELVELQETRVFEDDPLQFTFQANIENTLQQEEQMDKELKAILGIV